MGFFDKVKSISHSVAVRDQVVSNCKQLITEISDGKITEILNYLEKSKDSRAADCIFSFMVKSAYDAFNSDIGYGRLYLIKESARKLIKLEDKQATYNRILAITEDTYHNACLKCAIYQAIKDDYAKKQLINLFIQYSKDMDYSSHRIYVPLQYLLREMELELGEFGDSIVDDLLINLENKNKNVKYHIIRALGNTRNKKIIKPLSKLDKSDPKINASVIVSVGEVKDNEAIDYLLPLLNSGSQENRITTIRILSEKFNDDRVFEALNQLIDTSDNPVLIEKARLGIQKMGRLPKKAIPQVAPFTGHTDSVLAVAVTPDAKRVISGSADYTLKIWDMVSGRELSTLTGHRGNVNAVAVTPDGKRAVSGSSDKTLKVWDLETNQLLATLNDTHDVTTVGVTPDGKQAVSGSYEKCIKIWDLESGKLLSTLAGTIGPIATARVTPDGRWAVFSSHNFHQEIWDLTRDQVLATLSRKCGCVEAIAVTPDGTRAVLATMPTLEVWDLKKHRQIAEIAAHTGMTSIEAVAVTQDGKRAVTGSSDDSVKIWDLENGRWLATHLGHTNCVYTVAVTPNGKRAVSGSSDKTLKVWDF